MAVLVLLVSFVLLCGGLGMAFALLLIDAERRREAELERIREGKP